MRKKLKLAIFASGSGSNAEKIIERAQDSDFFEVEWVICNRKKAGVIARAHKHGIDTVVIDRDTFYNTEQILDTLDSVDIIALAGFLWLIPEYLIQAFENKILNIHPSLLPKYGGKGMYGMHVHKAVLEQKENFSGITIHLVNQEYDKGRIVFQASCPISNCDSANDIAEEVLKLEHKFYPLVVDNFAREIIS